MGRVGEEVKSAGSGLGSAAGAAMRAPRWTVVLLASLAVQAQVVRAVGFFEVQIRQFQNPHGILHNGKCCDLPSNRGQRCPLSNQCDTFFRACLKEYQARVAPTGTCTFGTGSTVVLGGNSHSVHHHVHDGVENSNGHIVIPFVYAWPKSFSLVLEALDHDNETSEAGKEELIERIPLSSMLNPGELWQPHWHHGRQLSVEYRVRYRCQANYYGPACNMLCRGRDDFFGHFTCDATGSKVCKEGWMGPECLQAACRQGCHQEHGSCKQPGECICSYGWKGPLCDECETFPGCDHGTCTEPWKCVCDTNWGGLLCDKDLNYCGNHLPCKNGGTCTNTEPNEYQCLCQEGFRGRNCDIVEHACLSSPCLNGATCVEDEDPAGFTCVCTDSWTGPTCADAISHCESSPCGRGATCQEMPHGFKCLCPPGWTGRTCVLDSNECELDVCINARSCRNLIGGYICDCIPGWSGPNCDIRNSSCHSFCLNGASCEPSESGWSCVCLPGFSGKQCEIVGSLCDSGPCLHGGRCSEEKSAEAVACNCPSGYTGRFCEIQVDPCSPNPCQQGAQCHSTDTGHMCVCLDGYYERDCIRLNELCHGQHCQGAMSDFSRSRFSVSMVLVGVFALALAGGCTACAMLLAHLQRHHQTKRQLQDPPIPLPEGAINNQRELHMLIRNLDHSAMLLEPPSTPIPPLPPRRCEEIELTLPPSPAQSHPSPALKPHRLPKLDISNREREKLNRLQYADGQELEV